ncbi:MAG: hypothetical protein K6G18_12345 [Treponema sp.]|nr:hypothetical protein [Treponema sp.]
MILQEAVHRYCKKRSVDTARSGLSRLQEAGQLLAGMQDGDGWLAGLLAQLLEFCYRDGGVKAAFL